MLSALLILQAREKKGQTWSGVRTGREGNMPPLAEINSIAERARRRLLGRRDLCLDRYFFFPSFFAISSTIFGRMSARTLSTRLAISGSESSVAISSGLFSAPAATAIAALSSGIFSEDESSERF